MHGRTQSSMVIMVDFQLLSKHQIWCRNQSHIDITSSQFGNSKANGGNNLQILLLLQHFNQKSIYDLYDMKKQQLLLL